MKRQRAAKSRKRVYAASSYAKLYGASDRRIDGEAPIATIGISATRVRFWKIIKVRSKFS